MEWTGCILALSVAMTGFQDSADSRRAAADLADLSRLEARWNEAHLRGDAEALDQLWADDLVVTVPGMPAMTKDESIAVWRSGRMRFQRYETSDITMRLYGGAAVVTGRLRRSLALPGRQVGDDWLFTKVYVRQESGWRVVAWHASPAGPQ